MVNPLRRITLFTGTRADYGLLRPLALTLRVAGDVELSFLVTGSHLSEKHGWTVDEIERDGFDASERVPILTGDDGDQAIADAMAAGMSGFAAALARLQPDCLVILGDRYEALAAACAATVCKIPIAHIHGGELSFGAMDDVFRHAITKMSHLHFCSTEAYRRRVIQMGEHPGRTFHSGAPGVENALSMPLHSASEVAGRLGIQPGQPFILGTFHPATLERAAPAEQLTFLLDALERTEGYVSVFTGANADAQGQALNELLQERVTRAPDRLRYFPSLGSRMYLSALRDAAMAVGNSSSGLIEAPSFGIPTVNIGSRQNGRILAESVISCAAEAGAIADAIRHALTPEFRLRARAAVNPYGKAGTAAMIADVLRNVPLAGLIDKGFYDLPTGADGLH